MVVLSEECSRLLNCNIKSLRDQINHPTNKLILQKALIGRKTRTTYADKNGNHKTVIIGGITTKGADTLPAYGRLSRPFNICVAAHFYARHRIKLHHPFLPCIIESYPRGENRFYPLEMLELVEEEMEPIMNIWGPNQSSSKKWFGNLYTTIEKPNSKNNKLGKEDE